MSGEVVKSSQPWPPLRTAIRLPAATASATAATTWLVLCATRT